MIQQSRAAPIAERRPRRSRRWELPSAAAAQVTYTNNLVAGGYGPGTPAHSIVTMPGRELWKSAMTEMALARVLCENFYQYGRGHAWRWVQASTGNGTPGGGDLGVPLLRGAITATNCGGFNGSMRRLAHDILGVNNLTNAGATTPDTFITSPQTHVIDSAWAGNVRTLAADFGALGAYFFIAHSWNRLGNDHYDATTNTVAFSQTSDLEWCKLVRPPGCTLDAWSVTVNHPPQPYGPPPYVVARTGLLKQFRHLFPVVATPATYPGGVGVTQGFINTLPDLMGGWGTLLLVSRSHLPAAFRTAIHYP